MTVVPQPRPVTRTQSFAWVLILLILTSVIQLPLTRITNQITGATLGWAGLYLVGFAVTVGLASWQYHRIHRGYQRLTRHDWGLMVAGYLFVLVLEQLLTWINRVWFHQVSTANNKAIAQLLSRGWLVTVLLSVTAIGVSPFLEEYLFRGLLIDGCLRDLSFWPPILISGIFFALVHANSTLASWLIYAIMGGTFAYIYRRTGKLQSTIILHAFNNLLAMGIMWTGLH